QEVEDLRRSRAPARRPGPADPRGGI
ncbi:MAG: LSU ribosomal protein L13p (L13Ae), partial [uncultured Rubrobacteraceae bacterium]